MDTILYEVPLLALVSESYFESEDTDWNSDLSLQAVRAYEKCKRLSDYRNFQFIVPENESPNRLRNAPSSHCIGPIRFF